MSMQFSAETILLMYLLVIINYRQLQVKQQNRSLYVGSDFKIMFVYKVDNNNTQANVVLLINAMQCSNNTNVLANCLVQNVVMILRLRLRNETPTSTTSTYKY